MTDNGNKITGMGDTKNHRKRVKDRFIENGADGFQDYELLELLLFYAIPRRDTKSIAKNLLKEFGSIKGVLDARFSQLLRCEGIGQESATLIGMLPVLLERYHRPQSKKHIINCSEDAVAFAATLFFGRQKEESYIICLNLHNEVIKHKRISKGGLSHVDMEPRDVMEAAIFYNASKIILTHNHPGNNLIPSEQDILLNNDIKDALAKIDIPLLDHIIIGEGGGYSMQSTRMIATDFYASGHLAAEKSKTD